jgi:hypothetical protein
MCIRKDIIAAAAYFDMFEYPLTETEVHQFLPRACSLPQLVSALNALTEDGFLYRLDEFYSLQNNFSLVEKRRRENRRAAQLISTAAKVSALLSAFPYVRCVAVSGSLSKGVADEKADIDFFIVCAKNRLWIGRTLLILFRKLARVINKQHLLCMNYFVDEAALEIEEKNIFTATEIVTLIPMRGEKTYRNFRRANPWTEVYFPNHETVQSCVKETKSNIGKRVGEWFFNFAFFNGVENYLQRLTARRYREKETAEKRNSRGVILSMKTSKHFAKQNPERFQFVFLSKYRCRVQEFFKRMEAGVSLFES